LLFVRVKGPQAVLGHVIWLGYNIKLAALFYVLQENQNKIQGNLW